jgi:hypothetical protein
MRAAPSSETVAANCSDASVARATDAEEAMEEEIEAVDVFWAGERSHGSI